MYENKEQIIRFKHKVNYMKDSMWYFFRKLIGIGLRERSSGLCLQQSHAWKKSRAVSTVVLCVCFTFKLICIVLTYQWLYFVVLI